MRREHLYLQDIREACDMIQAFLERMDASAFLASELHKAATLQKLTVIGEAAARLPQAFHETHPRMEWRDIIAFRNIAVHAYFAVQWDIVWATATDDVPVLRRQVIEILQREDLVFRPITSCSNVVIALIPLQAAYTSGQTHHGALTGRGFWL
jgi:uncharacterized protein with HEPN domain